MAGFDDIFIAGQLCPKLTTVSQSTKEIGGRAAEKLIALIEKEDIVVESELIQTQLQVRESVTELN